MSAMTTLATPTLVGTRVTLRAFRDDDVLARRRHGWFHEIERGYGADTDTRPMTQEEVDAWPGHLADRVAAGARCWAIESAGELAGAVFLFDVREDGRKARLAIGMYAPQFLGRGLGSETVRLVLRHAFGTLGMHRVDLKVLADNARAIAAYRACGFVEEGRERESCWVGGRWHDDVIMAVLDREFAALEG
jgi:RimJ/RimL family protein N-acetyltransferase